MSAQERLDTLENKLTTDNQVKEVPHELLEQDTEKAYIFCKADMVYLIEYLKNNEYRWNGRPYDKEFKTKNLPDGKYIRYQGEIYEGKPIKNEAGTVIAYDTKIGRIDFDSFSFKLNGAEMSVCISGFSGYGDYYDWIMTTQEDFKKNGKPTGYYQRALNIWNKMKNGIN